MDTLKKYLVVEQKLVKWEETRKHLESVINWANDQLDTIDPEGNSMEWKAAYKVVDRIDKGFDSALLNLMKLEKMSIKKKMK